MLINASLLSKSIPSVAVALGDRPRGMEPVEPPSLKVGPPLEPARRTEQAGIWTWERKMNFAGRWVPMEVMNALFIIWLIGAAIIVGLVFYFNRRGSRSKPAQKHSAAVRREKRHRGKGH